MSVIQLSEINSFLTQACLNHSFYKVGYDAQGRQIVDKTATPDDLARLVLALSEGMANVIAKQVAITQVQIPVTSSPGSPSNGILQ